MGVRTCSTYLAPRASQAFQVEDVPGVELWDEHRLWKKDLKELKQRLKQINTINGSVNCRTPKSGFQRLHIPCVYTDSFALNILPSHVPSSWSNFSLVLLCHGQGQTQLPGVNFGVNLCLGSPAHELSGQPEGQTEQVTVALTLLLIKKGTNFKLFLYSSTVSHKTCSYFMSLIFSFQIW